MKKAIETYRTLSSWQYRCYESFRMRRHREKETENLVEDLMVKLWETEGTSKFKKLKELQLG